MKKKYVAISLLTIGAALLGISIILAIVSTANKNIIGGANWPTYLFVFSREKRGLYSTLAFCGVVAITASIIVGLVKKEK